MRSPQNIHSSLRKASPKAGACTLGALLGAGLLAFSGPLFADSAMDRCLGMQSSVKRLACFEELTRSRRAEQSTPETTQPTPVIAPAPTASPTPPVSGSSPVQPESPPPSPTEPDVVTSPPAPAQGRENASEAEPKPQRRWLPSFGRSDEADPPARERFEVNSRIVNARRGTRYDPYVISLANGEVWRENEANIQRIKSDQDVVITKGVMNYSMRLENGRTILVRKIR